MNTKTNFYSNRLLILTCCTIALLFGIKAATSDPSSIKLPKEFGGIQLNMSLKRFLLLKPNTKHFGFFEKKEVDAEVPNQTLYENFNPKSTFDYCLYSFKASRLNRIGSFTEDYDPVNNKRDAFLKYMIYLYGIPTEIVTTRQNGTKVKGNTAAFIWRKSSAVVAIDFTLYRPSKSPLSLINYEVIYGRKISPKDILVVTKLKPSEEKKILTAARRLVARLSQ